ncbi:MAG: hypothetical protein M3N32_00560 [Actinomycetota bacterium]|nr:hypothetical protein [Actinomycetota bacterium]
MMTWDGSDDFLRREAQRDHGRGRLPRAIMIAFQSGEARLLAFCRHLRTGEPDLGMALFELAQCAQLTNPDGLLWAMAATLRPLTVEPLVGRATGRRTLVVQTATRSGPPGRIRVQEAARLLPYGLDDDGTLLWEEPVRLPEGGPTPLRRTLRAALLAGPPRPDLDVGEVAAMLVRWGHLIAVAPDVIDGRASRSYSAWDDDLIV